LDFRTFIFNAMIQQRVKVIAAQINHDRESKAPLFLCILNGSFMFAADLMKEVSIKSGITFVKMASYDGTESTGEIITRIGLEKSVQGRIVVIVEDIIDTGKTMHEMLRVLTKEKPARVIIATL